MNVNQTVYKKIVIGQINNKEQVVHIAFGVDKFYVPITGIFMTSIVQNNSQQSFIFHIFLDDASESDLNKLEQFCQQFQMIQINLYYLLPDLFSNLYIDKSYTNAIFYRIIAAEYLSNELDKLIYMDSDMLCLKSMNELFTMELNDNLLLAVEDIGEWIPQHKEKLNIDANHKYFNTGFLYINLKFWHKQKITEQMMEILFKDKYQFPDQDALNIAVSKNKYSVGYIPHCYNHFFRIEGKEQPLNDEVVIEHFAGQLKPWHPWCESDVKNIYQHYKSMSLWKDFAYLPRNYQENRIMGRYCRRNGNWLEAINWYYLYLKQHGKK